MNAVQLKNTVKAAAGAVKKNAPTILTAISAASTVSAVIFAVKATPKAIILLEEARRAKGEDLTPQERFNAVWKLYVPTAVMTGVSIGSAIGATHVSAKRNAALAGLYSTSQMAMQEYQNKIVETIGEKKEREVKEEIAKDHAVEAARNPHTVLETGRGDNLYYDDYNGRFFRSSKNDIDRACLAITKRLHSGEMTIGLNELWWEMGLPNTGGGEEMGFTPDNPPCFSYIYHDEVDGEQCTSIVFKSESVPKYEYYRLY